LSFFFIALAVAFQSVPQHFMEKYRRGPPAQYRRSIVRFRYRGFSQRNQICSHLLDFLRQLRFARKTARRGGLESSTRSKSMPSSARVWASIINRTEALGDTMALPSLDTIREFERCT